MKSLVQTSAAQDQQKRDLQQELAAAQEELRLAEADLAAEQAAVNAFRGDSLPVDGWLDSFAQQAADRPAAAGDTSHSNLGPLLERCSAAGEVVGMAPDLGTIFDLFAKSFGLELVPSGPGVVAGPGLPKNLSPTVELSLGFPGLPGRPIAGEDGFDEESDDDEDGLDKDLIHA